MCGGENLIHKRYNDNSRLMTDIKKLQLTNGTEVVIYLEDQYYEEIYVYLHEQEAKFEELKPMIVFVAENLCRMDCIAQKYNGHDKFTDSYSIAYVCIEMPDIIKLTYYGMIENTEFDVVFQHKNDELVLKSFGMKKDISPDWDN